MIKKNNNIKVKSNGLKVTIKTTAEELYRWAYALRMLVSDNARTEFHDIEYPSKNEDIMFMTSDFAQDYNTLNSVLKTLEDENLGLRNDLLYRKCIDIQL